MKDFFNPGRAATVLEIDGERTFLFVRESGGGCAGACSKAGSCGASSVQIVPSMEGIEKGDEVRVRGLKKRRGFLFYLVPFALFAVGFAIGDTIAPFLSLPRSGFFSFGAAFAAALLPYSLFLFKTASPVILSQSPDKNRR